jgi:hypothetical protein
MRTGSNERNSAREIQKSDFSNVPHLRISRKNATAGEFIFPEDFRPVEFVWFLQIFEGNNFSAADFSG